MKIIAIVFLLFFCSCEDSPVSKTVRCYFTDGSVREFTRRETSMSQFHLTDGGCLDVMSERIACGVKYFEYVKR